MKHRLLIIAGALVVIGVAAAGILYVTFPIEMITYGGVALNYLKTLFTPAGTVSTEANVSPSVQHECAWHVPHEVRFWP
jgi:hypothetical protein